LGKIMKVNVFSVFLFSFFVMGSMVSEDNASQDKPEAVEKVIEPDLATKGALIEAVFILQNKKNSLQRYFKRVKSTLVEVDHLIKDLVSERKVLFDHFYRNANNKDNMIDCILADLSFFYGEVLHINFIKGLYPRYLKQLQFFIDDITTTIEQFVNGKQSITFCKLKSQIDKFDNILDIVDQEERLIQLVLEAESIKLGCRKCKEKIGSRYRQLTVYEHTVKNKEDLFLVEQKECMERSIKKLKKHLNQLINDFANKQNKIKSLKQNLLSNYDQHQVFSSSKMCCGEGKDISPNIVFKSIKPQSLYWFIDLLEDVRKKLNKNFKLEDLV